MTEPISDERLAALREESTISRREWVRIRWVEVLALLSRLDKAEAGWQPIKTAPKNGTAVDLWGALEASPFSRPRIGSNDRYEAYWDEGWKSVHHDGYVVASTHWRPLPPPPSES